MFGNVQSASAWGDGVWELTPTGCNTGTVEGSSYYQWDGGLATAWTYESGNFCWAGNHTVHVAIHDDFGNGYGNASAANYVETYFPATYDAGWGGYHGWGDAYRTT